jgi:hypothetical protein
VPVKILAARILPSIITHCHPVFRELLGNALSLWDFTYKTCILPPSAASDGRTSGPPSSAKAKDKSLFHHQVAAEAIKELETNTNPPECGGTFSIQP